MKKYILILLSIISFGAFAQTYPTLPTGAKPYGNQLYIIPSSGLVIGGNVGYSFRVIGTKQYVDSLLALKQNNITSGTTGQYFRGDKTFQTLDKTSVGLPLVDNTSDVNKPISSSTITALGLKANIATPTLSVLEYADNAAAITAGLAVGKVYRTGDLLKIVH